MEFFSGQAWFDFFFNFLSHLNLEFCLYLKLKEKTICKQYIIYV
jgi:hypothetical protein